MYQRIRLIIFIVPLLLLFSCASQYLSQSKMGDCDYGDQLSYFSDNGSPGEFGVRIEDEFTVEDEIPGASEVKLLFYDTHLFESNRYLYVIVGPTRVVKTVSVLAFEDDKLIFWGFPEDYLKSDDEKIRAIGDKIADIIFEYYI